MCNMPHFKAVCMMNLQYEIRICHKIHIRHNESMAETSYYLFKWDRRYLKDLKLDKLPAQRALILGSSPSEL